MGTYTINTDADQEAALAQELKVANGKRLEAMQPEWTKADFVTEFFNQQFNPATQKWKNLAVARIVQAVQAKPELAPVIEAAISADAAKVVKAV